jgi:hypothetical protein
MRHYALVLLAVLLSAASASAGISPCNEKLVAAGFCANATDLLVAYSIPEADQERVLAAFATALNYQATVPCFDGKARVYDEDGILVLAGSLDGDTCSLVEIENPQPVAAAVDRWIRRVILSSLSTTESAEAHKSTDEEIKQTPKPEIGKVDAVSAAEAVLASPSP